MEGMGMGSYDRGGGRTLRTGSTNEDKLLVNRENERWAIRRVTVLYMVVATHMMMKCSTWSVVAAS
jgi:hypothetical protein